MIDSGGQITFALCYATGLTQPLTLRARLSDRLFPLPAAESERMAARLRQLPHPVADLVYAAADALDNDQIALAAPLLTQLRAQVPLQPDVLRLCGRFEAACANFPAAFACFEQALWHVPDDTLTVSDYAQARAAAGDAGGALTLRKCACVAAPTSVYAWYGLGEQYIQDSDMDAAREPLEHAVRLAPDFAPARLALGNVYVYVGLIAEAEAEYRAALHCEPTFGAAWYSLANIKTVPLSERDSAMMRQVLQRVNVAEEDRIQIGFALAKVYEDEGRHTEAFDLLVDANARKRRQLDWSAAQFSAHVHRVEAAFAEPHSQAPDGELGHEVIFIVSLPRSGSTLTEQILAAHSQVEGGSELHDLGAVLGEESARRRERFPDWVARATPQDWQRLGQRYLERTSRWRTQRPRFTDKLPENWLLVGAIMAMLPGARVIICRRDPLETCWSCFKQSFARGSAFAYDFGDLAAYWKDFDRASRFWQACYPQRMHDQVYENLVAGAEVQTRALLDFCALPFEPDCLRFHEANRIVRTASAAQVRQTLRTDTARASRYGDLLAPLREALGLD